MPKKDPSSTPLSLSSGDPAIPVQRRKRLLAKRSCISCREKKTRCELPDLHVPSSREPVANSKRCHRCNVLDVNCVVWDGDRKRKPRLPLYSNTTQSDDVDRSENKHTDTHSTWSPLSHLAYAAQIIGASTSSSPLYQHSPSNCSTATTTPTISSPSQSDPFFEPNDDSFKNIASSSGSLESSLPDYVNGIRTHIERVSPSPNDKTNQSHDRTDSKGPIQKDYSFGHHDGDQPNRPQQPSCLNKGTASASASEQKPSLMTWRCAWKSTSTLIDYAAQQRQFTRYMVSRIASPYYGIKAIDVLDMINKEDCFALKIFMTPYLAWHPHLPSLEVLYDLHQQQPNKSTSLLFASMCLVASRHRHSLSSSLMQGLSAVVDRLGTQVIYSSICNLQVVQAFELLLAQEPSLVGTGVCGDADEQAHRGNGLAGDNVLSYALNISKSIGIDKSVGTLHKLLGEKTEYDPTEKAREERTDQLKNLMCMASLWVSLRLWECHYLLIRPITPVFRDLNHLADDAKCMIAIDGSGNKVQAAPITTDGISTSVLKDHEVEAEEKLRSAGRTVLAHRIWGMATAHKCLAKLDDVLLHTKDEGLSTPLQAHEGLINDRRGTDLHTMDEIVAIVIKALKEQAENELSMQGDMAPYVLYESANLAEEWSQLEAYSVSSTLCTFGICALYNGRLEATFYPKMFWETLRHDKELMERVGIIGKSRLDLLEKLVASFNFFSRRLTFAAAAAGASSKTTHGIRKAYSGVVELIGAPILLTCGFVIDACKVFLEGSAFVLVNYSAIQQNFDARLLFMVQAAQRLEELDDNRYEQVDVNQDHDMEEGGESHGDDSKDGNTHLPLLSIPQLSAKFVREMVETLQKWRLALSIYRRPRAPVTVNQKDDNQAASSQSVGTLNTNGDSQKDNELTKPTRSMNPSVQASQLSASLPALQMANRSIVDTNKALNGFTTHNHAGAPIANVDGWSSIGSTHTTPLSGLNPEAAPPPTVLSQTNAYAHLMFPAQHWSVGESERARDQCPPSVMPLEPFLATGIIPTPTAPVGDSDISKLYDIPLINSFFDSIFPYY
ncbi:hypothetical protein BX616_006410 [Lobosporangium transversale]|uniref:Zn(2)-C6 fungal-type domain-containing protein n=1 Tax=Lobosporangium transversale TaxID=64571 RepID=A0A1Y2GBT5_9FUNG|nr:hypothetical protein BCR41DRAFT_389186 [Lobosporangium transversale]KAF9915324.1 hypothetical protein BX616_006410 [Lobosporangium transversale]ORZ06556.1 hypothetical protein BCR41DRAFT_389186 [Lobosporangium transversale]|eukprot:XP_021877599.1 hypothetical protein BCR41DRAFT_389186 [Lobosporangium transversale]